MRRARARPWPGWDSGARLGAAWCAADGAGGVGSRRRAARGAGRRSRRARTRPATARGAAELEDAIDTELWREARAFAATAQRRGGELDAAAPRRGADCTTRATSCRVSPTRGSRALRAILARAGPERYGGAFARAAARCTASCSRPTATATTRCRARARCAATGLSLPARAVPRRLGRRACARFPGSTSPSAPRWSRRLVDGCRKLSGQVAYYRALAGMERALPRGFDHPELARAPARLGAPLAARRRAAPTRGRVRARVVRGVAREACARRPARELAQRLREHLARDLHRELAKSSFALGRRRHARVPVEQTLALLGHVDADGGRRSRAVVCRTMSAIE